MFLQATFLPNSCCRYAEAIAHAQAETDAVRKELARFGAAEFNRLPPAARAAAAAADATLTPERPTVAQLRSNFYQVGFY